MADPLAGQGRPSNGRLQMQVRGDGGPNPYQAGCGARKEGQKTRRNPQTDTVRPQRLKTLYQMEIT